MIKKSKLVATIALILIIMAVGLLLYRGIGLIIQLKGEMQIENLYAMPTETFAFETAQPIATEHLLDGESQLQMPTILPQFVSLLNENSDTVGWLKLDDTRINHVIVQGDNNVYYLEHDFFGNKSVSATMMLDAGCDIQNIEKHYVIYGHRMKSGTMMNDILKYENKKFFDDNPIVYFDTIYKTMEWEVFSTYCKDYNYDNINVAFQSDEEWLSYIQRLQKESMYETDIALSADDVVLTLYTCDYRIAGGRYVLHARLVG